MAARGTDPPVGIVLTVDQRGSRTTPDAVADVTTCAGGRDGHAPNATTGGRIGECYFLGASKRTD